MQQNNPLEAVKHNKYNLLFAVNSKIEFGLEGFIILVKVSAL